MTRLLLTQINLFWLAVSFFTRLPVPKNLNFSQIQLNHASRYFTLVGWLIGLLCASVFLLAEPLFGHTIAIVLSMGFGFLLTGGFHEDGLADTADGFGGGWTAAQKLSIMKDSRLGSYGALVIWFALTLKYLALSQSSSIALTILIAHPLSRLMSTLVIQLLPYVSETDQAKSKPLAEQTSKFDAVVATLITLPVFLFTPAKTLWLIPSVCIVTVIFALFMYRQIKGFTGDTLGATQQINELAIYLTLLVVGFAP